MNFTRKNCFLLIIVLVLVSCAINVHSKTSAPVPVPVRAETRTCVTRRSPCFLKKITCPRQCPTLSPKNPRDKVCNIDCYSPLCKATCRNRKPNCSGRGAACLDPRFIGADGIVFYFHGKSNQHFSLVSDLNLQINARFIGHRPAGRTRDYTWIQALGILFNTHAFSLEATPASHWDEQVDHLKFSFDGQELEIPEGYPSSLTAHDLKIERTDSRNSVIVTIPEVAEISVNVVPITKEDDRIHNYQIPSDNCFVHLEVQFRFFGLSPNVEGVIGRTYRPDFKNPAKSGVAMPVVGGEDRYGTSTLLSPDCKSCRFYPVGVLHQDVSFLKDLGMLENKKTENYLQTC
ncbi:hypothetical protein RND81_12G206300 [Saponaria officinalis]|uniref:Uncharacterized protein n=1 Tax=Saponaria officinalis TaxID=3572 RepID=A0AAW1HD88_SAPOF